MASWYVYLIECRDGSLYTGIATDVDRRYAEHVAGKGARYTRSRPPLRLLARFEFPDRGAASRAEYAIKQLTPTRKRALCTTGDVTLVAARSQGAGPDQAGSIA
jgi:putative endonuclease